jgi:tRNA modification GTPase
MRQADDQFEIHCHGGNSASRAIIQSLVSLGAIEVSAAQLRTTLTQDVWSVSVEQAVSRTVTAETSRIALRQLQLLPLAIREIINSLNSAPLDSTVARARERLETILDWQDFGISLTQPRSIVFCGKPNVGKSSLVNAIVGFQRVIVHEVAGTTRDVVTQQTAIAGWPVELKDTAGIRESTQRIEAAGIEKAKQEIADASLRVCVFEHRLPWTDEDELLLREVKPELVVYNKADLGAPDLRGHEGRWARPPGILTAAPENETLRQGIAGLIEKLGALMVPRLPPAAQPIPLCKSHCDALVKALESLNNIDDKSRIAQAISNLEELKADGEP